MEQAETNVTLATLLTVITRLIRLRQMITISEFRDLLECKIRSRSVAGDRVPVSFVLTLVEVDGVQDITSGVLTPLSAQTG